jgi:hypothetical protein
MRAGPAIRAQSGPFVLPARALLLLSGGLALGLALFNLDHEFHAKQVDQLYTIVAVVVAVVWLASLLAGFAGSRLALFVAGAIGFVEFAIIASTHFVVGPADIDTFWKAEGLPVAGVDMALIPACVLVISSAVVCWSTPRGRVRRLTMLPVLIVALLGAVCVLLQATDDIRRADFGAANAEDGTFAAAVLSTGWLIGGLWIARARRTGALIIAVSTAGVWFSFVTVHLVKGGVTIDTIASRSGVVWAMVAAGATILAGASFLFSLGLLALSIVRPVRQPAAEPAKSLRRGA